MQSVCENPFQGDWKQQAAVYPTSRQRWIATAAALTMGRFAQSWRESASAAAAANNLEKTSGFQRYSPERRQLQPLRHWPWAVSAFWCPAPRHYAQSWRESHASFGRKHVASALPLHGVLETRQRLLTATFNIGVQCRMYNVRLKSYLKRSVRIMKCFHNFIFYQSIILEENSRQNCFASSMLSSLLAYGKCWHHKLKETNVSCTWTGLQLAFWPQSPMAASETPLSQKFSSIHQKTVEKNASIVLAMMY